MKEQEQSHRKGKVIALILLVGLFITLFAFPTYAKLWHGRRIEVKIYGDSLEPIHKNGAELTMRNYPFDKLKVGMIIGYHKNGNPVMTRGADGKMFRGDSVAHIINETHLDAVLPYVITQPANPKYTGQRTNERITQHYNKHYYGIYEGVLRDE